MTEVVDYAKDGLFLIAGGGIAWKIIVELISKMKSESKQTITVNAGNATNTSNGHGNNGNGKSYATAAELSSHALSCAGAIHEKINSNYIKLSEQINENHRETMKVFAELKVDITQLESMRSDHGHRIN